MELQSDHVLTFFSPFQLVLDAGQVAEYDSPANLLKKKDGFLHGLIEASDDKIQLLEIAGVSLEDF